jgi:hypothetical protein
LPLLFCCYILVFVGMKYLVHPLLGRPDRHLPTELLSAFRAADTEVALAIDAFRQLDLSIKSLADAREEIFSLVRSPDFKQPTRKADRASVEMQNDGRIHIPHARRPSPLQPRAQ